MRSPFDIDDRMGTLHLLITVELKNRVLHFLQIAIIVRVKSVIIDFRIVRTMKNVARTDLVYGVVVQILVRKCRCYTAKYNRFVVYIVDDRVGILEWVVGVDENGDSFPVTLMTRDIVYLSGLVISKELPVFDTINARLVGVLGNVPI